MIDNGSSHRLSDVQELLLALLPIPASILSILGSSIIIHIALDSRSRKKCSPYTRLLLGLSVSDIVASINVALAAFLRPADSPHATSLAVGNATTCSISGCITTAAGSSMFYTCMLSYYFLLTVRFRLTNSFIARRIEPLMHFISLGYPIITALIGAYYNAYADTYIYFGCWLNSKKFGWIFTGYPFILVLASLVINNLMIWCLAHGQAVQVTERKTADGALPSDASSAAVKSSENDDSFLENTSRTRDETFCGSDTMPMGDDNNNKSANKRTLELSPTDNQRRRLQLVKSQAFLFVVSYALVTVWNGILGIFQQRAKTEDEYLSLLVTMYPIMVLNCIFAPMQGFFNMLVYVRPKYKITRQEFRDESRWWVTKRAILGERKVGARITQPRIRKSLIELEGIAAYNDTEPEYQAKSDHHTEPPDYQMAFLTNKRINVSTLTSSRGDFDDAVIFCQELKDEEQDRWGNKHRDTRKPIKQAPRYYSSLQQRGSCLEIISEMTETQFEPMYDYPEEMVSKEDGRFKNSRRDSLPTLPRSALSPSNVESRWGLDALNQRRLVVSVALKMPERVQSSSEMLDAEAPLDRPLQVQIRSSSMELNSEIDEENSPSTSARRTTPSVKKASYLEIPISADRTPTGITTKDIPLRAPMRSISLVLGSDYEDESALEQTVKASPSDTILRSPN